jgi:hypothetical protein
MNLCEEEKICGPFTRWKLVEVGLTLGLSLGSVNFDVHNALSCSQILHPFQLPLVIKTTEMETLNLYIALSCDIFVSGRSDSGNS